MNATMLHEAMLNDIRSYRHVRIVSDPNSPMQEPTYEAEPGRTYTLDAINFNVPRYAHCAERWARANVLHFFADTERAEMLPNYNKNANRFVTDGKWLGAYGYIAMPQIRRCIDMLQRDFATRRAIVSMGDGAVQTVNSPACWSFLQFLQGRNGLDLLVYQRSLSMRVMPYDCILLTNILHFVSDALELTPGSLRWTIGSLHLAGELSGEANTNCIILPYETLVSPALCLKELLDGLR